MVADYLAAAALSESILASDPSIDVMLERSLYRSSDGEYEGHGGQTIRVSSELGRRQFGEAEYPYQDMFHVLIRAPLTSPAPWIIAEEYGTCGGGGGGGMAVVQHNWTGGMV